MRSRESRRVEWRIAAAVLLLVVAAQAAPGPSVEPQVNSAIEELKKEYQSNRLRTKCDYFAARKIEGMTPELLLKALGRSMGGDTRLEAYVKWQLLSTGPMTFDEKMASKALSVYGAAPGPIPHPGLNHQALQKLLGRGGQSKEKADEITKQLEKAVEEVKTANAPILAYRDELMKRMPTTTNAVIAGLGDLRQRVGCAAEIDGLLNSLAGIARVWAMSTKDRETVAQAGKAVEEIRTLSKSEQAKVFTKVKFRSIGGGDESEMEWTSAPAYKNDRPLLALEQSLGVTVDLPAAKGKKK